MLLQVCVLDIDVQGVKQLHQTNLNPWYVFVKPPSLQELEKRLRARNTESEESLAQRLKVASEEMEYGNTLLLPYTSKLGLRIFFRVHSR